MITLNIKTSLSSINVENSQKLKIYDVKVLTSTECNTDLVRKKSSLTRHFIEHMEDKDRKVNYQGLI